jgi:hypothetical protein
MTGSLLQCSDVFFGSQAAVPESLRGFGIISDSGRIAAGEIGRFVPGGNTGRQAVPDEGSPRICTAAYSRK